MTQAAVNVLASACEQVLERGEGLSQQQVLEVLQLPDDRLEELLALAHEVRMRWCGPEVEVEGIISLKTGGCPEDCHFCSQSGLFSSPVRSAWLDIPSLVEAAKQTAKTGATEFCIVAAVRGPDERLMAQMREGVAAIHAACDINVAASLGMLSQALRTGEENRPDWEQKWQSSGQPPVFRLMMPSTSTSGPHQRMRTSWASASSSSRLSSGNCRISSTCCWDRPSPPSSTCSRADANTSTAA